MIKNTSARHIAPLNDVCLLKNVRERLREILPKMLITAITFYSTLFTGVGTYLLQTALKSYGDSEYLEQRFSKTAPPNILELRNMLPSVVLGFRMIFGQQWRSNAQTNKIIRAAD